MSGYSMKCGVVLGGLACALVATTPVASADDDKLKAFNKQVSEVMRTAHDYEDPKQSTSLEFFSDGSLTACGDAVAAGKAAGLTGSSKVYASAYGRPGARKDDKGDWYLTLDEVQSFCKDYDRLVIQEWTEAAVVNAFSAKQNALTRPIEGMYPSEAERVIKRGETCNARVDAALAANFPASHVVSSPTDKLEVKLGDAKAEYCQPVLDWGTKRLAEINGAGAAKQDEIARVYAEVGIKGDRLKLFSSIGLPDNSGFLAPGCEKYVDTAQGLAKAKKLFTWFESDDGSILVTKYTFKGNKYKETEKRYPNSARAYKGCK